MKRITWQTKESWVETKSVYPNQYTDYLFCNGWVTIGKLFPDVKSIYAIGGYCRGSHIYWHNFKRHCFGKTLQAFKQFFCRIDLGRWYIIITKPDPDRYRNVEIISKRRGER